MTDIDQDVRRILLDRYCRLLPEGIQSNCGRGMPLWQLREECGCSRKPVRRLRFYLLVRRLAAYGVVRLFTAVDTAGNGGTAIEYSWGT